MASQNIYTPSVNSYEPAFPYQIQIGDTKTQGVCNVYFVLSDYNLRADIGFVHASVIQASTNYNVVDTGMDQTGEIKTAAGIILNLPIQEVNGKQGLYYVTISGDYINDSNKGWNIGSLYKIQLRLTEKEIKCDAADAQTQIAWLNVNASKFSEWSTTITTKAIGADTLEIPVFNQPFLTSPNLDIVGAYSNEDPSEKMYSARVQTYQLEQLLDDSGIIYKDSLDSSSKFSYSATKNLQDGDYKVRVTIITINKHSFIKDYSIKIQAESSTELQNLTLASLPEGRGFEEDEGCIALKIVSSVPDDTYQGTLRIRRASEKDNFTNWEDIYEIKCDTATNVADIPLFKDFTVESGTYYKYGLQEITWSGSQVTRSKMKMTDEISRLFEYTFLVGAGGRQLKLRYDLNLNNFQKTYSDVITPTIGGKYPFITRVGSADYYNFSMSGKISFSMDENNLFLPKDFAHGYTASSVVDQYDFTYERKFRDEVYKFLTDGKPKLFKSPSEGNLVVRLSSVSMSPVNNLSRLIYNFSATATELDEATVVSYKKYDFISELDTTILN